MSFAYLIPDINEILKKGDLETISAKGVRRELKIRYPDLDVKAHKADIDVLIVQAFEQTSAQATPEPSSSKPKVKRELSPPASSPALPLKKPKPNGVKREETDEELARRLHAEMNGSGQRATRGGGALPAKKKKSTWGKKSKATVDSDDDESNATGEKKKRKVSATGFNKPWALSDALSDVLDQSELSRPQVTKQLWAYIKAHDLQDPSNKMTIIPDEKMGRVFGSSPFTGFQMAKLVGKHLYPTAPKDETVDEE